MPRSIRSTECSTTSFQKRAVEKFCRKTPAAGSSGWREFPVVVSAFAVSCSRFVLLTLQSLLMQHDADLIDCLGRRLSERIDQGLNLTALPRLEIVAHLLAPVDEIGVLDDLGVGGAIDVQHGRRRLRWQRKPFVDRRIAAP